MAATIHDGNYPYKGAFSVTPSDTVDLVNATRAIRATTAGNIKVTMVDGSTPTCAFAAAETRQLMATRIWSTGTTATGIEGMF